jgi:NAD(P)-dependent dehydrogenase (short-subunit alcohol dehydrogenase family)
MMSHDKIFWWTSNMATPIVSIVFGGSSGMGKHAAIALAKAGHQVVIASSSAVKLLAAAQEIRALAGVSDETIRTGIIDATNETSVASFFSAYAPGSVAHLVITLGPGAGASTVIGAEGFAGLRRQFDLKFFAQMACVSYGAPILSDGGSITLFTGALAKRPGKGSTALATANAALDAVVKGLANDLGPRVRVNSISPGLVDTEVGRHMQ